MNFNSLMRYRFLDTQSCIFKESLTLEDSEKSFFFFLFSKMEEKNSLSRHLNLGAVLNVGIFRELMVCVHSYPVDSGRLEICLAFSQRSPTVVH